MASRHYTNNVDSPSDMENGNTGSNGLKMVETEEELKNALNKTVTLSPDLFERIYLSPKDQTSNDLRKKFANPTPVAIMGFVVGCVQSG
jgi:hypothetical protein